MAWSPGNRTGGGIWRTLAAYSVQKERKAAAQNPVLVETLGSLDRDEESDTLVATSVVVTVLAPRSATLAITEDADTVSAAGQLKVKATLAVTEANDTLAATVGPLLTPTITNVSASGTAPLVLSLTDGDYVAGKSLEWEFAASLTPSKNADGSYVTPSQRGVTFIEGDSWARLDIALGYNDPTGPFAFHCRVLRDNESGTATVTDQIGSTSTYDASAWTTDYTDSIIESVALLTSATGVNKSQYLKVLSPFKSWVHTANVGGLCGTRATLAATNTKWHAEFSIDGFGSSGGTAVWSCGIVDAYVSGDTTRPSFATIAATYPGLSNVRGMSVSTGVAGSTTLTVKRNGGTQTFTIPAVAIGDRVILEVDSVAGTVQIKYYDLSATSTTTLGTITISSTYLPTSWYHFGGGVRGNGTTATSDSGTAYFDPADWVVAASTGYDNFYA